MNWLPNASLHRPRGWVMHMDWDDLLFMHWDVDAAALASRLPKGLQLDTFEGRAWISVVPFRMRGTRLRFTPDIPALSAFPELNVRTYVRAGGMPGVWFFSLDAGSRIAVRMARHFFHLPYFDARMRVEKDGKEGGGFRYASRRAHWQAPPAAFEARYAPSGPAYRAPEGSLEDWLTARYCLYAADGEGNVLRSAVHHRPWRLQPAEAEVSLNTMLDPIGLSAAVDGRPPLLQFAAHTEVVAWMPERVAIRGG